MQPSLSLSRGFGPGASTFGGAAGFQNAMSRGAGGFGPGGGMLGEAMQITGDAGESVLDAIEMLQSGQATLPTLAQAIGDVGESVLALRSLLLGSSRASFAGSPFGGQPSPSGVAGQFVQGFQQIGQMLQQIMQVLGGAQSGGIGRPGGAGAGFAGRAGGLGGGQVSRFGGAGAGGGLAGGGLGGAPASRFGGGGFSGGPGGNPAQQLMQGMQQIMQVLQQIMQILTGR